MKRVILAFMVISMILSLGINAGAEKSVVNFEQFIFEEQEQMQPRYNYTLSHVEDLLLTGGQASCKSTLTGKNGTTTKIEITMTLQKKALLWWESEGTWSGTYNTYYGTLRITKAAVESGTYRIKTVYKVYSGSDSETITAYSSEKKC